jgi:RNA polymerase sigma-70 factor (ECF subfamily)
METDRIDDIRLTELARHGELPAFEELVRRYQGPLYGYLCRMCRNPDTAEELAQIALVKAWTGLAGFRAEASFKTWLFRIATNCCLNELTRNRHDEPLTDREPSPERWEPAQAFRNRDDFERVNRALAELPADQRSALLLSVYEDMPYAEIARVLGRSVNSVNALLYRARLTLRQALNR